MVKYQDGIMKFKYNQPPTSVLRYGGLSAYFETLLLNQSLGIFSNFGAKNPPHRKAEKRCTQYIFRTAAERFAPIFSQEN